MDDGYVSHAREIINESHVDDALRFGDLLEDQLSQGLTLHTFIVVLYRGFMHISF